MMGTKQKLTGIEEDVVFARQRYCYLVNHPGVVKWAKKQMNKRLRVEAKKELQKEICLSEEKEYVF